MCLWLKKLCYIEEDIMSSRFTELKSDAFMMIANLDQTYPSSNISNETSSSPGIWVISSPPVDAAKQCMLVLIYQIGLKVRKGG